MALRVVPNAYFRLSTAWRPSSAASWSAAGWAKREVDTGGTATVFYYAGSGLIAQLRTAAGGDSLALANGGGESASFFDISDNEWFFWCLSCANNSAGGLTIYLRKLADSAFTITSQTASADGSPSQWGFGAATWGGEGWDGRLDSMFGWNRPLTEAEVEVQWRRRRPVVATSDLLHWIPAVGDTATLALTNYGPLPGGVTPSGTITVEDGAPITWGAPIFPSAYAAGGAPPVSGIVGVQLEDAVLTAAGKLLIAGEASVQLEDALLTAAGKLLIAGDASVQLEDAILSAAGKLLIAGEANVALEDAVLTAAGTLVWPSISGSAGVQLEDAVLTAAGKLLIAGIASVQLEDAVLTAVGRLLITGALGVQLEDAVLTAAGAATAPPNSGQANVQLEDAVLTALGRLVIKGTTGITLEDAVLTAYGTSTGAITGTLNVTLDDAVLVARATLRTRPPFHDAYVVRADDVADYLANRFTPPRKKGRRLSIREQVLVSQRDDMFRRRSEGS